MLNVNEKSALAARQDSELAAVTRQRDIAVAALKCVVEMPRAHSSVRIATMALAEIEGEDRDV